MPRTLDDSALYYHRQDPPGKLAIVATKPLANQVDLSLAYSPGVAAACRAIAEDAEHVVTHLADRRGSRGLARERAV